MEILQRVRIRRRRWRVTDIHAYDNCTLIDVDLAEPSAGRRSARFLTPFDDVETVHGGRRPRIVRPQLWRRACRALLATDVPPGCLHVVATANLELFPHQLEPALAVVRGVGCRLLLADDVGLGKTIQAGLIVAELLARGAVERVLILAPAALTAQWTREMSRRFSLTVALTDASTLRQIMASLPIGINPWTTAPIAVSSIDYVKRPEVLPAVLGCRWDVVVVDEAHTASVDSDRRGAVHALSSRAAYVVLLTATPHNGDERAFASVCSIGSHEDQLVVFRRTRQDVRRDAVRRTHMLRITPTADESRMFDALGRYARAIAAEHGDRALALSVLEKRAFSSAWSLARSIERRLSSFSNSPSDVQMLLPFDDPDGEQCDDDAPPTWPADLHLADESRERRLLSDILNAANRVLDGGESKLRALRRLLRRAPESAVIFTEYRDTAAHVRASIGASAAVLHGGLNRDQRSTVLDDFARRPNAILVATDAAGQGLNLHATCRLVVNLELPWNPMRLEQRIGRVDRIGQARRVHAFLFVSSETGEGRILDRLERRLATASDQIGSLDTAPSFAAEAKLEISRVALARSLASERERAVLDRLEGSGGSWKIRARRSQLRVNLRGRSLLIYRLAARNDTGRLVESHIVGIEGAYQHSPALDAVLDPISRRWGAMLATISAPFWSTRIVRELKIAASVVPASGELFQSGLFDRRLEHAHLDRRAADAADVHQFAARLAAAERQSQTPTITAELMFVIDAR